MTTIRTTCNTCGEVDLHPDDIVLAIDETREREGAYRFECPKCLLTIEKRADRKIVALLVSAGVEIRRTGEPGPESDNPYPEARPQGPVLTLDDLIDLHFEMEKTEFLAREVKL